MPWAAELSLLYRRAGTRTVVEHRHQGPLRVLQSLYPEGDAVCHTVLVHPPGGLVGGDALTLSVEATAGAHALITTAGATRFYRSADFAATQRTHLRLHAGARLEWLPLETLCYSGCIAENHLTLDLAPDSELLGWDLVSLGLPRAQQPFVQGSLLQHFEYPGKWLERGLLRADDTRLLDGAVGLAGYRCMASLFLVSGNVLSPARRDLALELARAALGAHGLQCSAGATNPNPHVVILRTLAPLVEPAVDLLRSVWMQWRHQLWGLPALAPRIWST